jgi:hypothetical protein
MVRVYYLNIYSLKVHPSRWGSTTVGPPLLGAISLDLVPPPSMSVAPAGSLLEVTDDDKHEELRLFRQYIISLLVKSGRYSDALWENPVKIARRHWDQVSVGYFLVWYISCLL